MPQPPNIPTRPGRPERIFLVVLDDTVEMSVALQYACRRADRSGGRVALLYVIEPTTEFHFLRVEDLMREEARERAEQVLLRHADEVFRRTGRLALYHLREGHRRDELLRVIEQDPVISILVLAAGVGPTGPGPLIAWLTSGEFALKVPLTIVPGALSDEQLDAIT